jgi:hypothetical protein
VDRSSTTIIERSCPWVFKLDKVLPITSASFRAGIITVIALKSASEEADVESITSEVSHGRQGRSIIVSQIKAPIAAR